MTNQTSGRGGVKMSNERDVALAALKAAGHDQAAALVDAIIPAAPSAATLEQPAAAPAATSAPEIPSMPVPAAVEAATPDPNQRPPGIMSPEEMAAFEQSPNPRNYREQQQQMSAIGRYVESQKYYQGQG